MYNGVGEIPDYLLINNEAIHVRASAPEHTRAFSITQTSSFINVTIYVSCILSILFLALATADRGREGKFAVEFRAAESWLSCAQNGV